MICKGILENSLRVTNQYIGRCLISGGIERTTGDTLMHLHSSRSHAIFTITLELVQDSEDPFRPPAVIRRSKLHLVDLAGKIDCVFFLSLHNSNRLLFSQGRSV